MEFCGQLVEILVGNDDAEDHVRSALFNDVKPWGHANFDSVYSENAHVDIIDSMRRMKCILSIKRNCNEEAFSMKSVVVRSRDF